MSAIGPGDWVECIRTGDRPDPRPGVGFGLGKLYCVREVSTRDYLCPCGKRHAGLRFTNMLDSPMGWWSMCAFRPIYRPRDNAEFIEKLKTPAPPETVEV